MIQVAITDHIDVEGSGQCNGHRGVVSVMVSFVVKCKHIALKNGYGLGSTDFEKVEFTFTAKANEVFF